MDYDSTIDRWPRRVGSELACGSGERQRVISVATVIRDARRHDDQSGGFINRQRIVPQATVHFDALEAGEIDRHPCHTWVHRGSRSTSPLNQRDRVVAGAADNIDGVRGFSRSAGDRQVVVRTVEASDMNLRAARR